MKLDTYNFFARLCPLLVVGLPVGLAVAAWFQNAHAEWALLSGVLTSLGFSFLLTQLGRDPGKLKEAELYQSWGGKPTTRKLRHSTTDLDWISLERCHVRLGAVVGMPAPTKEDEQADLVAADQVYEAYTRYLREATRDKDKFRLVFAENVSYGFRRNLWGWKPWGIRIAGVGLVVSAIALVFGICTEVRMIAVVATVINGFLFYCWCSRINSDWVRLPAEAYADRLLGACDVLFPPESNTG